MKCYWVVLLLVAALVGCGNGFKNQVVGSWKIDVNSIQGDKPKPEELKQVESVRLDFKDNGTFNVAGFGQNKPGKWSLKDHTIVLTMDKASDAENVPALTLTAEGTKIHMSDKGGSMDLIKA